MAEMQIKMANRDVFSMSPDLAAYRISPSAYIPINVAPHKIGTWLKATADNNRQQVRSIKTSCMCYPAW